MSQYRTLLVLLTVLVVSTVASATCTLPSIASVRICTPGNGETVNYPAAITASASGKAPITKMAVYVDGERIYFDSGNQLELIDGGVKAGSHRLTVRAWDSAGNSYASTRHFTVVGGTTPKCVPSTPGVKLCSPANGSLQPVNEINVIAGATGNNSRITRLKVFWNGYTLADTTSSSITVLAGSGNPGVETLTAKAWDAAGNTYTTTTTFKTYYSGVCSDYGCDPGVFVQSPSDGSTVDSSFSLSAEVRGNPAPITGMKAYLDGQEVASSGGPTLSATLASSSGSHRLTVHAWDSQGHLYRTVYHVNVR